MNLLPAFGQDGESAAPGRRPDAVRVRVIRAPAPKAKRSFNLLKYKENLAPEAGIEPATIRLTVTVTRIDANKGELLLPLKSLGFSLKSVRLWSLQVGCGRTGFVPRLCPRKPGL